MPGRTEQLCIERGLRMTGQRRVVARVLSEANDHPDAEEVYRRASKLETKISIATVYRTLRIFEDSKALTNLSLQDVQGEALVISQFTLYADVRKGRRPSFIRAAKPEIAEPLVKAFADALEEHGVPTKIGEFGAHMLVEIDNDGPMTILLEREPQ